MVIGRNRILTVGIPRQKIRVQICKLFRNIQTHAIGNGKEIGGILVVVFQRIHGGAHHVFDIAAVSAKRSCQRHIRFRNVLIEIVEDVGDRLCGQGIHGIGLSRRKIIRRHNRIDLGNQQLGIVIVVHIHQRRVAPFHGFGIGLADLGSDIMVPKDLRLLLGLCACREDL